MKKNILKNNGVQSLLASLLCIVLGLLIGYIVLLFINPTGAGEAIMTVIKNFLTYNRADTQMKYFGNTLVKTAPLLMCALSILFAYKVGLFNIGAAGQYCFGVALSLYAALGLGWSWLPCMLLAIAAGCVLGAIVGLLKAYCNVNEVISGIMLNWIMLYTTNMILTNVKEATSPYTVQMRSSGTAALLPTLGLDKLFNDNGYVTLAIPLAILLAIVVDVVLNKTRFGYELRATGNNKFAAKYCGMAEKRNIILSLMISGALAGMGGFVYAVTTANCSANGDVAGFGFLALAVMIFGNWKPLNIAGASLLFGLFKCIAAAYSSLDINGDGVYWLAEIGISSHVYRMLPYLITLVVLAFTSKKSRAPKAEGIPYDKGQRQEKHKKEAPARVLLFALFYMDFTKDGLRT